MVVVFSASLEMRVGLKHAGGRTPPLRLNQSDTFHMGASGEHVYRGDFLGLIPLLRKQSQIPREGCGVAGDVDDAFGGKLHDLCYDFRGEPFAWGIYDDDVRLYPARFQLLCGFARVAEEEFCVLNPVGAGIFLCVCDGGGDNLRADGVFGTPCHDEGDGTRAAVEVEEGFLSAETCVGAGCFVEPLCLGRVDLKEGAGGESEIQPAEGGDQGILAPEGAEVALEDDVARITVDAQEDAGGFRTVPAEGLDQLILMRQFCRGCHDAEDGFAARVAHEEVADETLGCGLVIGCDLMGRHPRPQSACRAIGGFGLDKALGHRDNLMAPAAIEAGNPPRTHGEDCLVAVMGQGIRADDGGDGDI